LSSINDHFSMNAHFIASSNRLTLAVAATFAAFVQSVAVAAPCAPNFPCAKAVYVNPENEGPSWIFMPSAYTHDPQSGARVAQYMRKPPVEPLEDQRAVTSRYRRTQTNLRGTSGSYDTYYEVQSWGNGRGGIDAEWERFHDAWKDSYLQGGYYNQGPGWGGPWNGNGPWHGGWNGGWGGGWNGGWNVGPGPGWGGGGGWNGPPGPGWGNGGGGWGGGGNHASQGGGHGNHGGGGNNDD
jgi:hypothetical protein